MADKFDDKLFEDVEYNEDLFEDVQYSEEPPIEAPEDMGWGEALARGTVQGATMDFGDEIAGGAEALWDIATTDKELKDLSDLYEQYRDESRKRFAQAEAEYPYTYGAGGIVGGIGTMAIPGMGAGRLVTAGKAGLKQLAKEGAKQGAKYGAASGLGRTEEIEDVPQVVEDVATGTALGAGFGAAVPFALKGAGKAASKTKDAALNIPGVEKGVDALKNLVEKGKGVAYLDDLLSAYQATRKGRSVYGTKAIDQNLKESRKIANELQTKLKDVKKSASSSIGRIIKLADELVPEKNFNEQMNKIYKEISKIDESEVTEATYKTLNALKNNMDKYKVIEKNLKIVPGKKTKSGEEEALEKMEDLLDKKKMVAEELGESKTYTSPEKKGKFITAKEIEEVASEEKTVKPILEQVFPDKDGNITQEAIEAAKDRALGKGNREVLKSRSLGENKRALEPIYDPETGFVKLDVVTDKIPTATKEKLLQVPIKSGEFTPINITEDTLEYFKKLKPSDLQVIKKRLQAIIKKSDPSDESYATANEAKATIERLLKQQISQADERLGGKFVPDETAARRLQKGEYEGGLYGSANKKYSDIKKLENLLEEIKSDDVGSQIELGSKIRGADKASRAGRVRTQKMDEVLDFVESIDEKLANEFRSKIKTEAEIEKLTSKEITVYKNSLVQQFAKLMGALPGSTVKLVDDFSKMVNSAITGDDVLRSAARLSGATQLAKNKAEKYRNPAKKIPSMEDWQLQALATDFSRMQGGEGYSNLLKELVGTDGKRKGAILFRLQTDPTFKKLYEEREKNIIKDYPLYPGQAKEELGEE